MNSNYSSDYTLFKKESEYYNKVSNNKFHQNSIPLKYKLVSSFNDGGTINIPLPTFFPIPIVSVDIDTNLFKNPIVNIEFKSLINYNSFIEIISPIDPKLYAPLNVIFQLTRSCNNGSKSLLKSWNYGHASIPYSSNIIENFNFVYCDKHPKPGNYVYSIEIVNANGSLLNPALNDTESCSIMSSTFSATAFESFA